MKSLISFLIRNAFIFMFLILEGMSIFMVVRFNGYRQNSFYEKYGNFSGKMDELTYGVKEYFILRQENEILLNENTKLRDQIANNGLSNTVANIIKRDSIHELHYKYRPAKVIRNSVSHRHNFIVIDKGSKHGVAVDMAIITETGVVGIVKDVSPNFSTVISVLNSNTYLSAKIKKNNMEGSISWDGQNYRNGTLLYIPSHAQIQKGDSIVTSGNSFIFPEEIPIGVITGFEEDQGSKFYRINISFANDFKSLHHVYIVENLMQREQIELLNQSTTVDE